MLDNLKKYDVVLASNSPRRRELLSELGVDFRVETLPGIDETPPPGLPAMQVAEYVSQVKAKAYALAPNELLITADTVVILGDEVLGKPHDAEQARTMLRHLSGQVHHVVTGVSVTTSQGMQSFSAVSAVEFDNLTDDEIDYYVTRYKPMDKAGAYGIQEWIGFIGVKGITGSFYNVMGLPVQRLYSLLKTL
ncbi:MAG: septum formation protein Maf [Muribaculaceae bacterium]|jgi:septum formation protein|nr:septum formation protein Maf [Muribaculaceae bacterium]